MHNLYNFVSGPLVWITFIIFIGGCLYRIINMLVLVYQTEKFIFSYMSFKYSLRSILYWLTPFATVNMRRHPIMTIITFAFHLSLLIIPLFLSAHIILLEEAWNIVLFSLPDKLADFLTLIVIGSCIFFLIRRLTQPEVKYVSSSSDYLILSIVAAPFITGFLAYHQVGGYQLFLILHILSGEIMLMAIPFTRLSHMLFSIFTRAYMGSEFGGIRKSRDW